MARPAGFEPATYRLEGGCSNPLSYGRPIVGYHVSAGRGPSQRLGRPEKVPRQGSGRRPRAVAVNASSGRRG
jgi:hypothetical protein